MTLAIGCLLCAGALQAARQGPWTAGRAWAWYDAQPWIRGCNYMPASAANRVDQWQALGSEERFAEVDRELAAAEALGFNTMRLLVEWCGFGVWLADPDGFMSRFERYLSALDRHHMRAIVVLGNDCSRPKRIWKLPAPGEQPCDWGYHGGRKASQHGSFPGEIGFTPADDPELAPKFYAFCEELMTKYGSDSRILFWNVWNEPGNNGRGKVSVGPLRRVFEIGWRVGVEQPMAADVWMEKPDPANEAERVAGELSDIVSYHCYGNLNQQQDRFEALKRRFGRPAINTEWLARTLHNEVFDAYPYFAQNRIGCTMWGLVAGKYQTYEPWEHMWNDIAKGRGESYDMSKWFHDLLRPSLRPYDPRETNVICRINAEMDAEHQAKVKGDGSGSLRMKIAAKCKVTGEDMWYGYRRTKFDFGGRAAWVVEPSVAPAAGMPWTWTMQWAEAFVDRTGVPDLLRRGFHHATIDLFDTRMDETGLKAAEVFQKFLTEELGFAPRANLVGMSWGGFFSMRYAATHPESVTKIYLDAPLLNFDGFGNPDYGRIGVWANRKPPGGVWSADPEMPVNMSEAVAAAKIPILLVYGGSDTVVPPARNSEPFAESFQKAGGEIKVMKRALFGHHPHGLDPDKTDPIVDFFTRD